MNRTVVVLSLRSLVGRRRGVLLFVLPLLLLAVAALVRALAGTSETIAIDVLGELGFGTVVPLVALIAATGILAPEIDDGSIVYLLAKPIPRSRIVLSKVAVAIAFTALLTVSAMALSTVLMAGADARLALAYAVGTLAASAAYSAVFVLLAVLTKHSVVWGLVYWLLWEGLLGSVLSGVRWLSITSWSSAVADQAAAPGVEVYADLGATYAWTATLVALALALWFATRRLRAFNLTGDD